MPVGGIDEGRSGLTTENTETQRGVRRVGTRVRLPGGYNPLVSQAPFLAFFALFVVGERLVFGLKGETASQPSTAIFRAMSQWRSAEPPLLRPSAVPLVMLMSAHNAPSKAHAASGPPPE